MISGCGSVFRRYFYRVLPFLVNQIQIITREQTINEKRLPCSIRAHAHRPLRWNARFLDRSRSGCRCGEAIALGHPIGCTGVRITTTLLHEMNKRSARLGLSTLCVSGGMGLALLVESL